jgi:hypothetical protein
MHNLLSDWLWVALPFDWVLRTIDGGELGTNFNQYRATPG